VLEAVALGNQRVCSFFDHIAMGYKVLTVTRWEVGTKTV